MLKAQGGGRILFSKESSEQPKCHGGARRFLNEISGQVIKAAITVHKELGPGLLESVYQSCMAIEFKKMGLSYLSEVQVPVVYQGQNVHESGFRLDLLVEDAVIVELKSVEHIKDLHKKQLLTYLRLTGKPLGLLINFNEALLKDGITRIINQASVVSVNSSDQRERAR